MAFRRTVALAVVFVVFGAGVALADSAVDPRPGVLLTGKIKFPRAQEMWIHTGDDGTRLSVAMGFDGRCRGGGLGELWSQNVAVKPPVAVKKGRFSATLTGVVRKLGGIEGRDARFRWRLSGRFVSRDMVNAVVSGRAEVRSGGRVISRCTIAKPTNVQLKVGSA